MAITRIHKFPLDAGIYSWCIGVSGREYYEHMVKAWGEDSYILVMHEIDKLTPYTFAKKTRSQETSKSVYMFCKCLYLAATKGISKQQEKELYASNGLPAPAYGYWD